MERKSEKENKKDQSEEEKIPESGLACGEESLEGVVVGRVEGFGIIADGGRAGVFGRVAGIGSVVDTGDVSIEIATSVLC